MNFTSSLEDQIFHIKLDGNLIGEEYGASLVDEANKVIEQGAKYSIIDIEEVKYINSSGIGVLITLLTKFRNKEGEIVLLNPSDHVQKLMIITKLTAIFKIAENKEEAIKLLMA